jgi:hypothetical protein
MLARSGCDAEADDICMDQDFRRDGMRSLLMSLRDEAMISMLGEKEYSFAEA